jgi:hypothetical protein
MDFYPIVQLLYNKNSDKAEDISTLTYLVWKEGNATVMQFAMKI